MAAPKIRVNSGKNFLGAIVFILSSPYLCLFKERRYNTTYNFSRITTAPKEIAY